MRRFSPTVHFSGGVFLTQYFIKKNLHDELIKGFWLLLMLLLTCYSVAYCVCLLLTGNSRINGKRELPNISTAT